MLQLISLTDSDVVIETTGLADPGKLISIFWMDDAIESALKLDGVVTVVDAKNMDRYLASPDTKSDFTSQVAYADRILINKTDLITPQQVILHNCAFIELRRYV
jgi:G3E family GTPase